MALIVEDGTGLVDAESYISVTEADLYHANRGNASWSLLSTTEKEIALRKATEYLDATYCWKGDIASLSQALNFPRENICDNQGRELDNIIPVQLKNTTAQVGLIAIDSELVPNTTRSDHVKREKVGELEIEYKDGAPTTTQYNYVNRLLDGLFSSKKGESSVVKLTRS